MAEHPITPPPELVEQWRDQWINYAAEDNIQDLRIRPSFMAHMATQAARWGADQELEACCEWLLVNSWKTLDSRLRAARRPKPPSLAEEALMALEDGDIGPGASLTPVEVCIIRRALERLQELEKLHDDQG